MSQESSLVAEHTSGEIELYLTDIVLERTDTASDYTPPLSLTELWVFDIPDSEKGNCYTLMNGAPGQWLVTGFITLGLAGIRCVAKSKEGEDVAFVHLDRAKMCSALSDSEESEHRHSESMEMCGKGMDLIISWKKVETPLDTILPPEDISALHDRGVELMRQFLRTGDLADEAIPVLHRVVQLTPEGHTDLPAVLNNLGILLHCRFEHTGDLADITEAISVQHRAVQLTPKGHGHLATFFNNLGRSFRHRFECTGDLSDITEAISAQYRAVELTPEGHADLPGYLDNLGISFQCRFEHTGDSSLSDIDEAISARQRAVQLTPQGHPDLPMFFNNVGNSFQCRFECTGDFSDITEAISAQHRAVQLTPEGHAALPARLNNLGASFMFRFNHTGDISDIAEAISAQHRAVQLTPNGHTNLPSCLNNLGASFMVRFKRTGDLSDIAEAISAQHRAVQLTPKGHADLPARLSNLGISFRCRFERTRDLFDITEAISAQHKAVQLTPEGHGHLATFFNSLGNSFRRRFEHTRNPSDITEAISAQHRAVQLTPGGHSDMPGYMHNLGNSFLARFECAGDLSDLAEAISAGHRAVKLTPEGHASLPMHLSTLGDSFLARYKCAGDPSDIAQAISVQHQAVELTPKGHANLPGYLIGLGNSFRHRFEHTHSGEDLAASISNYKSAATSSFGPPRHRLQGARTWVQLLNQHHPQSPDILHAFDTALALVALIAGLEESVQGRYSQLQDISGVALEAASAACSLGRADKALEWLEQGRCIVWSQLSNLRTPIDDLRLHNSQLAQSVVDISKQLENAGSSRGLSHTGLSTLEKMSLEDEARAHLSLAQRWDGLLQTVRSIPGFESFLQPLPCSSLLQHLPLSGPVVVINVDKQRCDAIALLAGLDEPLHIPLPDFSLEKAKRYQDDLKANLDSQHLRMRKAQETTDEESSGRALRPLEKSRMQSQVVVRKMLRDLWNEVLSPILNALGFSRVDPSSGNALSRIWWCPTGPLSFLPIHAAGTHSDRVLDYAVSSYIPTITALTGRIKNHQQISKDAAGLFLTSQPNAPGASPIPGTTKEAWSIYSMAVENGARVTMLEGGALTVDECLQHMEDYSCIHLACHASQNATEPLKSRFLFHNGSLDLAIIIRRDLKNADLAFLSACQTSTGDEKLSDEAVHLAAGMLAAGYRRVVATMWSIGDGNAPEVANDFYSYLFSHQEEGSGNSVDGSISAYALHHAIQQLRGRLDNSENSLLAWVPYVHFGY
ncbi:CHAT domain-containing protein [Coprinopsis sp. MPI-PUGE-AT-0042]|nr:CHAT domain-containing protein [Coprinopsis sp. MPI-PUGE-AT-0042]